MINESLAKIVGASNLDVGADIDDDDTHDESLGGTRTVLWPWSDPARTEEVAAIVRAADPKACRSPPEGLAPVCPAGAFPSPMGSWCPSSE